MTTTEIILIIILWIFYGFYASVRTEGTCKINGDEQIKYILFIAFAPLVFIIKCLYGAFKIYRE